MEKPTVRVFYRHGCHLCEDMMLQLTELQESEQFNIESIDVDSNTKLQQQYGHLVPVIEGGGTELCRYYLDEKALTDYFRSYASKVS